MSNDDCLIDSFGRKLDYLRISITDRCNLRCVYCMPREGVKWKPHSQILNFEEIIRITEIMASLGIKNIKVTGGEPLLRRGALLFIKKLKTIPGIEKVTLTTNGLLLGEYLDEAEKTGNSLPDAVNISINALEIESYKRITRSENADPKIILPLLDRLLKKNITVKINCVPVRSVNEREIFPLVSLARDKNIFIRFIELMPVSQALNFQFIKSAEIIAQIEKAFGALSPDDGVYGSGPAVYYNIPGFTGKLGFINPMTHNICESCSRLRLTSEGILKPCLSNDFGIDLKEKIRSGAGGGELVKIIKETAAKKPRSHSLSEIKIQRCMSQIGG